MLKLAVLILPGIFCCDSLHDIPVLGHLAIFYSPEIIEGCGSAAKRSFGYSQNIKPFDLFFDVIVVVSSAGVNVTPL